MSEQQAEQSEDRRKYEFRKVIEDLKEYRGTGTQLVTIYVPPDKHISDVVAHVTQEHSEASNIKSKDTRTNVQDALSSIKARLKYYDTPPENGMVLFSGAVDAGGGQTEMVTETLENPPREIQSFRYHCDSEFLTEPLESMLTDEGLYGLVVLDRREANVGWLKGKRVEPVKSTTSLVPGKQRKGGQSAQRFARLRLEAIDNFYQEFLDGDYLHHEIQEKVLGKFDVAYTDESGLYDLVDAGSEALADAELMQDKDDMETFFKELHGGDLATYGFEPTRRNLVMGSVETLLISEDLRQDVVVYECPNDHEEREIVDARHSAPDHECSECGEPAEEAAREDVIEHLMDIADERGTEMHFISTDFEKGEQLLTAFGGVAGILRYSTGV
ncbi:MAG: peptide chain release factor aRF-1 [Halanaeroarchaeum sp.]